MTLFQNLFRAAVLAAVLPLAGIGQPAHAASVPQRFRWQARLTDSAGVPLSGPTSAAFSLWLGGTAGGAGSGTLLYRESATITVANGGVADWSVGNGTPTAGSTVAAALAGAAGEDVFLQVAVGAGGDVIIPRTRIDAVPYALASADGDARTALGPSSTMISITQPGSYYLTGPVTVPAGNSPGILITADDVTLDLNGFSITGTTGTVQGIMLDGIRRRVAVSNGSITGMGDKGIWADNSLGCSFRDLRVEFCLEGISVGQDSIVASCSARGNVSNGIHAISENNQVRGCVASYNKNFGIYAEGPGTLVVDCVARGSRIDGFAAGANGCLFSNCTSYQNKQQGFHGQTNVSVTFLACVASGNGWVGFGPNSGASLLDRCVSTSNTLGGVELSPRSAMTGCVVADNGGDGVRTFNGGTIRDCTISGNRDHGVYVTNAFGTPAEPTVVSGCTIVKNGKMGLLAQPGQPTVLGGCLIESNGDLGAYLTGDSTLRDCAVRNNGRNPFVPGISATDGVQIAGDGCRIDSNDFSGNGASGLIVRGVSNLVVRNQARGNNASGFGGQAYDIDSGNSFATVLSPSQLTGTAAINPLANISY